MPCFIEHKETAKYVFLKVDNEYVVVSLPLRYHADIVEECRKKWEEVTVCGGGWIKIDEKKKCIILSGTSTTYGSADKEKVKKVLEQCYPTYTVILH